MAVWELVTTVGAADANAYVSLAVADQYHNNRPPAGTTWATATGDDKRRAILYATKLLDALVDWEGYVVDDVQALAWPRYGLYYRNGYPVDSDIIPTELQEATAEFARELLASDQFGNSDLDRLRSISLPGVSLHFNGGFRKWIPDCVSHLIPDDWGVIRSGSPRVRELRRA